MRHCDLCGKASDRVDRVEDLWGLGVSTLCADPAECAETWGEGFERDPNETAVLQYAVTFGPLDKAEPRATTQRLARQ